MLSATRILSWFELILGAVLFVGTSWLLFDLQGRPQIDHHGYLKLGALAGLVACALLLGGATLRAHFRWRWLGQIPLMVVFASTFLLT